MLEDTIQPFILQIRWKQHHRIGSQGVQHQDEKQLVYLWEKTGMGPGVLQYVLKSKSGQDRQTAGLRVRWEVC